MLHGLSAEQRERNAVPDEARVAAQARAAELLEATLGEHLQADGLRTSVLGPGWSTDIDVYLRSPVAPEELAGAGWVPLDALLRRMGSGGAGRWLVRDGDRPLAIADLDVGRPPEPLEALLTRARRRREVRVREVLELRALLRSGAALPEDDDVVAAAASAEAALGGTLLARWRRGEARLPPVPLAGRELRRAAGRLKPRSRVLVAVSGVDGAGKSTLSDALVGSLDRVGISSTRVWTRPGMRLRVLDRVARAGKRLLRQRAEPGIRTVAGGTAENLASRRGIVGWTWALLVTLAFVRDVRRRFHSARGVVVFDRHLLDALATLDFAYGGVNLRVQRALIRRGLPRADLTLYLRIPVDVAVARKPDDVIGRHAVETQLRAYDELIERTPGVRVLDATLGPDELARRALDELLQAS